MHLDVTEESDRHRMHAKNLTDRPLDLLVHSAGAVSSSSIAERLRAVKSGVWALLHSVHAATQP